ncbi:MAG: hypothetical protein COY42_16400 [Armatimonadetes bacterium CG_4_10_14_0_8_um_filter_66_14]|nr:cell division protein SepF [Armatimonadota bacterium]PIZ43140.1 MAG: hypothetical protein COY42_16400 [Armatimonadetes bacterium CG_4_10_14_0_8_um_filter_66_14]
MSVSTAVSYLKGYLGGTPASAPARSHCEEADESYAGARSRARLRVLPSRGKSIFTISPQSLEDAYKAAEYLVAGSAVVANLQELDRGKGQRIVDVLSGVAFGIGGASLPTGDRFFVFVPHDFSLTPDDKRNLAETGLFADGFEQPKPRPGFADGPPPEMRTGLFARAGFGPRPEG